MCRYQTNPTKLNSCFASFAVNAAAIAIIYDRRRSEHVCGDKTTCTRRKLIRGNGSTQESPIGIVAEIVERNNVLHMVIC